MMGACCLQLQSTKPETREMTCAAISNMENDTPKVVMQRISSSQQHTAPLTLRHCVFEKLCLSMCQPRSVAEISRGAGDEGT